MGTRRNLIILAVVFLLLGSAAGFLINASLSGDNGDSTGTATEVAEPTGDDSGSETVETEVEEIEEPAEPCYQIFNVDLAMSYIEYLSTIIGYRPGGTSAENAAAEYVRGVFRDIGYGQVYEQSVPLTNGLISRNIYVVDEGSDPGQVIVIGGHMDSAGGTGSPGANDNGSGVAAVLELARVFKVNDNLPTLVFVVFGSEEILEGYGRDEHHFGSRYMADHLTEIEGNVIGMISIDMVGVGSYIVVNATLASPGTFTDMFMAYASRHNIPTTFRQDKGWSDHEGFERHGISSFWIEYREDPYYHSPQDSYDKIQPGLLNQMGHLLQGFLESLDASACRSLDAASNYR